MVKKEKIFSEVEKEWSSFVETNNIVKKKGLNVEKKVYANKEPSLLNNNLPVGLKKNIPAIDKTRIWYNTPKRNFFKSVEKNKMRQIKLGKLNPECTLDLHGFTLANAQAELRRFTEKCVNQKKRFLLIITGKGNNSRSNYSHTQKIIKNELFNWLNEDFYSHRIQYISTASTKHGGGGAYYFFLKKL